MAKRTWIKVKRGLLEPKHREQLGEAWFVYFYCLDVADWNTGVISDWKDKDVASELGISLPTVRRHRLRLEEQGYIKSEKRSYGLRVSVCRWTNPRVYHDDEPESTQVRAHVRIGDVSTPTSSSHITNHIKSKDTAPEPQYVPAGQEFDDPKPKTAKQQRKERDALLDHPAVMAYRSIVHLNVDFTWRAKVAEGVGADPANLKRWEKLVSDWVGYGWKKTNIKGMLEAFVSGGIKGRKQPSQDAKSRLEGRLERLGTD